MGGCTLIGGMYTDWGGCTLIGGGVNSLLPDPLNPLSLSPDENEISLYMITTCLNIQVTRIKEVITDNKMS